MTRDLARLPDLVQGAGLTGPARVRRPVYVDLLPPCNAACPAGENIQAWLAAARDGEYEKAWRLLAGDNPFPAIHGRVCYHPCEDACNRAELDSPVSVHAVERFLGDWAIEHHLPLITATSGGAAGSGGQTAAATARHLAARGERVGAAVVRLFRPFPGAALRAALPSSTERITVLDRSKEPGSLAEPLCADVLMSLAERGNLLVTGGRYGLSSKEFTPGMVAGVFAELAKDHPRPRYGETGLHAQGYFVYDSRKSGSETVSHLRFGPDPISAPYLIKRAGFVGVHHARLLGRDEVLDRAAPGAVLLLNTPAGPDEVFRSLPPPARAEIARKKLTLYAIDAGAVARDAGLGGRINTVLQTCFFAISGVLPPGEAIPAIKKSIEKRFPAADGSA